MGGGEPPPEGEGVPVTFEGGHESADEPNYNRQDSRPPRRDGDRGPRRGGPGGRGGHGGGRGDRRGPRR
jgi:hypothetical protein